MSECTQIAMAALRAAFPVEPIPRFEEAVDVRTLYDGELSDLMGKSWVELTIDRGWVLITDAYFLTNEGFEYYLPFFVYEAVNDLWGNFALLLGAVLNDRKEKILSCNYNSEQINCLILCLECIMKSDYQEDGVFVGDESDLQALQDVVGLLREIENDRFS